jgi:endothelin-converting enzyme/putative endopeptidase
MSTKRFPLIVCLLCIAACDGSRGGGEPADGAATPAAAVSATPAAQIGAWGIDLSARDESVTPGDDFNRHANGRWLDTFEIPPDLSNYGTFVRLRLDAEEDLRAIVEDLSARDAAAGTVEQQVGDFYAAWMDEARLETLGAAPLEPYLAQIAAIGTKTDLMRAFASLHLEAPFAFSIIPDPADTTRYAAVIEQSGLGLPDRDYYLEDDARFVEYRDAYRNYAIRVMTLAGIDQAEAKADEIIALETRLAQLHWTRAESRDIQKIYNPMSPAQVAELAPELDWTLIFKEAGLGDVDTFVVAQPTAIGAAAELFDATPIGLLRDYLAFHLIRRHAEYLSRDFDAAHFELYSRTLSGTMEQRERWKRGVQQVDAGLGEAVGRVYVERHFPPAYKEQMDELIRNLVAAMKERLERNDWMDDETRMMALTKLATFEPRIGYPSKWTDYASLEIRPGELLENARALREFQWRLQVDRLSGPVDRELWDMSPQTVNAYYNPLLNQITFPAAILQPPFFDPNADPAVNYGAIGAVIGHEIGHGFDDQGRRFDEQGRIRDWWTATADARFSERATRLGAQYDTYEPLPGMHVNGQLTMGENIGDLGGVQMGYAAYRRYLDQHANGVAPVVDGLTGDQRFFLSWAQAWRSLMRDDVLRSMIVTNPHSPPEYRVNGVVRNVDAWYEAFGVTPQHALYLPPEQRVRIW